MQEDPYQSQGTLHLRLSSPWKRKEQRLCLTCLAQEAAAIVDFVQPLQRAVYIPCCVPGLLLPCPPLLTLPVCWDSAEEALSSQSLP